MVKTYASISIFTVLSSMCIKVQAIQVEMIAAMLQRMFGRLYLFVHLLLVN